MLRKTKASSRQKGCLDNIVACSFVVVEAEELIHQESHRLRLRAPLCALDRIPPLLLLEIDPSHSIDPRAANVYVPVSSEIALAFWQSLHTTDDYRSAIICEAIPKKKAAQRFSPVNFFESELCG